MLIQKAINLSRGIIKNKLKIKIYIKHVINNSNKKTRSKIPP